MDVSEAYRECDSCASGSSHAKSYRYTNEVTVDECSKSLRTVHESLAVNIGDHNAPIAANRETQVFDATDLFQRRRLMAASKGCVYPQESEDADEYALLSHVLVDRFVLADRYEIKSDRVSSTHVCRFAKDRSTAQDVFLKFYSRFSTEFKHAVMMHKKLKDSDAVCKLIEVLPNPDGLPPCLVFEAGSLTLEEMCGKRSLSHIEQQDALHSILRALCDVHGRNVVHGCLDSSHVVWFSTDFCWKLVNFEAASTVGDPIPMDIKSSPIYAAPEILKATEQDSGDVQSDASSDMWSFGLIAFEILTGTLVLNAAGVKKYITRERRRLEEQQATHTAWSASGDHLSKSVEQQVTEFDFVLDLLDEDPSKRKTAAEILERAKFRNVAEDGDLVTILDNVICGRGVVDYHVPSLGRWLVCHVALRHLDISLSVKRFAHNCESGLAFYERGSKKIRTFSDSFLPKDPVYVLTAGKSFGIRISIEHDRQLRFPLGEIVSVRVVPPDSDGVDVEVWQCNGDHTLDALAHVHPSRLDSSQLNSQSPILGLLEDRYVRLTVHVKLRLGNGFPYEIDAYPVVYLQLRRPARRLKLPKILQRCKQAAAVAFSSMKTPSSVPQTIV